jgi:hypothetical protein
VDPSRRRFLHELTDLHGLLDMIALVEEISGLELGTPPTAPVELLVARLKPFAQPARLHRAEYAIAIAFGYAAFERFIRDLLGAVAHLLSEPIAAYGDLPEEFRKHHLTLSLRAAGLAVERDGTTPPLGLLGTLVQCLQGDVPFSINGEVFSDHTANFRSELIRSSFRRLGLQLAEEDHSRELKDFVENNFAGLYAKPSSVVDDLADRRNVVAHGDELELLDRQTLRALLAFLEQYSHALCAAIFEAVLKQLAPTIATTIGQIEHTWQPGDEVRSIGKMKPVGGTFGVGDVVVLTGQSWRTAVVTSIESQHVAVLRCGPSEESFGVDFAVQVHKGEEVLVFPGTVVEAAAPYAATD